MAKKQLTPEQKKESQQQRWRLATARYRAKHPKAKTPRKRLTPEERAKRKHEAQRRAAARYYAKNREREAARSRVYRAANLEKTRLSADRYREQNLNKELARCARYRADNREKISDAQRKRHVEHPELRHRYYRKWYEAKRAAILEAKRARYLENQEKEKQRRERYRAEHPDKTRESNRKWAVSHPEKVAQRGRNRRARELGAEGHHTPADVTRIFDQQIGKCAGCGAAITKTGKGKYHIDHVMPLCRGGSNNPDNLQLLCPPCNHRKNDKHPDEWRKMIAAKATSHGG